jgi:N-acetylmuramic acid 6-phosphate (MurNAc-6-P) etherase
VGREEAGALLEEAGGHVKTAIVMGKLGVGREEAADRLRAADGLVSRVVGELA